MALKSSGQRHFREKCLSESSIAFDRYPSTFWTFSWACNLAYITFHSIFIVWGLFPLLAPGLFPFTNDIFFGFLPHWINILAQHWAGVVGLAGVELVSLVATVGLYRGAWMVMEGQQPRFADLIRWDGAAIKRLFLAWSAYQLVLAPPLGLATLVGHGLRSMGIGPMIWWPIGLLAWAWLLWFGHNQFLFSLLCLFQKAKPFIAMRSSMQIVKKEKLSSLIDYSNRPISNALLGFRNFFNPWDYFYRLAAYRQVFGADDRLGLIKPQS